MPQKIEWGGGGGGGVSACCISCWHKGKPYLCHCPPVTLSSVMSEHLTSAKSATVLPYSGTSKYRAHLGPGWPLFRGQRCMSTMHLEVHPLFKGVSMCPLFRGVSMCPLFRGVLYSEGLLCVLYSEGLLCVPYSEGFLCVLYSEGFLQYVSFFWNVLYRRFCIQRLPPL